MAEILNSLVSRTAYVNKQRELVIVSQVKQQCLEEYLFETGLDTWQFWVVSRQLVHLFYLLRGDATINILIEVQDVDNSQQARVIRASYQILTKRPGRSYYLRENISSEVESMTIDNSGPNLIILKSNGNVYYIPDCHRLSCEETLIIDGSKDPVKYLASRTVVTRDHIYRFVDCEYGKMHVRAIGDDFKIFNYWNCRIGKQFALMDDCLSIELGPRHNFTYPGLDAHSITRMSTNDRTYCLDSSGNAYRSQYHDHGKNKNLTLYRSNVTDLNGYYDIDDLLEWNVDLIDYIDSNGLTHRAGIAKHVKLGTEVDLPGIFITDNALFLEGSHLRDFQAN